MLYVTTHDVAHAQRHTALSGDARHSDSRPSLVTDQALVTGT